MRLIGVCRWKEGLMLQLLWTPKLFGPIIFGPDLLCGQIFWSQIYFRQKQISDDNFFCNQNLERFFFVLNETNVGHHILTTKLLARATVGTSLYTSQVPHSKFLSQVFQVKFRCCKKQIWCTHLVDWEDNLKMKMTSKMNATSIMKTT